MRPVKEYVILLSCVCILLSSLTFMGRLLPVLNTGLSNSHHPFTVVIDAGHGGFDPGKTGVDGTLEKDVNLIIAKKLERLLKAADVHVLLTREGDDGLYDQASSRKKRDDMLARTELINASGADCVISIHQNSYPDESIRGAQVFYYTPSESGRDLAALIQKELVRQADPENHRKEKGNETYYLLKHALPPTVIVECGFLSNREESKKLVDDTYQQTLAWAIHMGVLQYLNGVSFN